MFTPLTDMLPFTPVPLTPLTLLSSLTPCQVCLLECEAQTSPALTWDLCHATVSQVPTGRQLQEGPVAKREDYDDPTGLEDSDEVEISEDEGQQQQQPAAESQASEWFRAALKAEQVRDAQVDEEDEEQRQDDGEEEEQDRRQGEAVGSDLEAASLRLAKRFGGFMRGRHSYRKLVGRAAPGMEAAESRRLQKRYGGFIGIRKSARKWNSQKRVSQLLRQYLTLTGRPGRFNNLSGPGLRRPIDL